MRIERGLRCVCSGGGGGGGMIEMANVVVHGVRCKHRL